MDLIDRVLEHEGFKPRAYQDHLGVWTIGHGITVLTYDESAMVVKMKIDKIEDGFDDDTLYNALPREVQEVLIEMVYQLGWTGVQGFKKMWAALRVHDYQRAAEEMLDSRWAKQTPNRANKLAEVVKNVQR